MKNKSKLWFLTNSATLHIHTQGAGSKTARTYSYQSQEDFQRAIKGFLKDGYVFVNYQGI
jgi:hypothetical protein